uniref:Glyoxal oxidase N-terminal domain-containing protein n=1 Tax=Physcomitrium patens TaxID=3218 RepID=A0A2K1IC94_PHYPA|nr:hypothetical protein PHYPA_030386 [Physcomitrium patens]
MPNELAKLRASRIGEVCRGELGKNLATCRWYSSSQLLPSGIRQIIVGGRNMPSYKFYPRKKARKGFYNLGKVMKEYPQIPGNPHNYPSAGFAAMLHLTWKIGFGVAETMVCGGVGARASNTGNANAPASASCGTIVASSGNSTWAMQNRFKFKNNWSLCPETIKVGCSLVLLPPR